MLFFINTWWFNLLGYLVSVIFFSQFYKLAVKNVKHDGTATALLQILAAIIVLFFSPLFPFSFPKDIRVYLMLITASVFYAINDRMQTTARKNLPVSTYVILDRLSAIFIILFGFTIFNNPFTIQKVLGAALILLGNVIVIYKKGKFELNKYVVVSILASLAFSVAVSIDIGISKQFNLPFYIMLTLIIPAFMISLAERITPKDMLEVFNTNRKDFLITSISWSVLIVFLLRAYQLGEVAIVASLAATSVILNVLVAYVFLKEKDNRLKKIIAAMIAVIGVCFTVI